MPFVKKTENGNDNKSSGGAMVKLGVLWHTKEGSKAALTGRMGDANLVIFPNDYKEEDNHPDYVVYAAKREKREDTSFDTESMSTDVPATYGMMA